MKFLVVLAVVLFAVWLWRSNRRRDEPRKDAPPPPAQGQLEPQDMVRCPVCSVHLPRSDALPGPGGQLYCCAEHRQRAEK